MILFWRRKTYLHILNIFCLIQALYFIAKGNISLSGHILGSNPFPFPLIWPWNSSSPLQLSLFASQVFCFATFTIIPSTRSQKTTPCTHHQSLSWWPLGLAQYFLIKAKTPTSLPEKKPTAHLPKQEGSLRLCNHIGMQLACQIPKYQTENTRKNSKYRLQNRSANRRSSWLRKLFSSSSPQLIPKTSETMRISPRTFLGLFHCLELTLTSKKICPAATLSSDCFSTVQCL